MSDNGHISIEQILAMDDAHRTTVAIPEWKDAKIDVYSMTATERADIERRWANKRAQADPAGFRGDILERSLKKPDGSPFATADQIKQLMGKNANAVERLFEAACEVSGFTKKDVEELEKNS